MKASLPNISASTASIIIRKLNRFFKSTSSNLLPPSSKTNFSFPQVPPPPYPQPPPYFRRYRHNPYFTGASEDDTGRGIGSTHVAGSHISGTKVGGFPLGERLTAQRAIDATLSGSDADQTDVPVDIPQSPQARSQPTAIGGILCSSSSSECSNHTLAASPSSVTAGDQQTVQLSPSERAPPFYLALRSGMRLDELTNLAPIHVLEAHPTRISLYWGAHTKSSRLSPFEPQLFVVVGIPHPHNQYHPPNYMKEAATLLSRPRSNRPYSQLTARQWLKMLRLANPNATGHSLKRTTALRAFTVMASNPQLPPWLLPLVLKHKTPTPIAAGDIRYACETPQARVAVAAALRTELLTQHL